MKKRENRWLFYAVATAFLWGTWGAFIEIPEKAGFPATLGYSVWALTMIPVGAFAYYLVKGDLDKDRRSVLLGFSSGLLGCTGQLLLFEALRTGPAYLVFPFVSVAPVITILLSYWILKEKANRRAWTGIFMAVLAIFFLSYQSHGDSPVSGYLWAVFALLVATMWGLQAFVLKSANNTMRAESLIVYSSKFEMNDGTFRNASILIDREGKVAGTYYKNYPTIGEIDKGIVPGKEARVFQCDFGTVGMLICFDLNFEELKKEYARQHPDILVFSSRYQGGIMQKYWALSCRSFFVSACEGIPFLPSEIYDPLGERLAWSNSHFLNFAFAEINLDSKVIHRDNMMGKMMALKRRYGDAVTIEDPSLLDMVLLSSYSDSVTVEQMMKEAGIETADSYLQQTIETRLKEGNLEK